MKKAIRRGTTALVMLTFLFVSIAGLIPGFIFPTDAIAFGPGPGDLDGDGDVDIYDWYLWWMGNGGGIQPPGPNPHPPNPNPPPGPPPRPRPHPQPQTNKCGDASTGQCNEGEGCTQGDGSYWPCQMWADCSGVNHCGCRPEDAPPINCGNGNNGGH